LHRILRDEIYRIAAEALLNAFSHARARKIEVEIRYHDDLFRLGVRTMEEVSFRQFSCRRAGKDTMACLV